MDKNKKWCVGFLAVVAVLFVGAGALTVIIDPFFHYHPPLDFLEYPIDNERYHNNGILKNFTYDAVVTGTSMAANFKASEADELFGVDSVKVTYFGGSYREVNESLERAIQANPGIKCVIRGLDYNRMMDPADKMNEEAVFPEYLYDDQIFNDVEYLFNKQVLVKNTIGVLAYTWNGNKTPDFDEYSNWMHQYTFGKEAVAATYGRPPKAETSLEMTQEESRTLRENITQNVTDLAKENPKIDFYLFFTPYSIYYWDELNQKGELERHLQAEKEAIELMLEYENIHLFSFSDEFGMICDLDNYKDIAHYGEDINSRMLVWMSRGEHQLTKENYLGYCERVYDFYTAYDYDALFVEG